MKQTPQHFSEILSEEYENRTSKNSYYSMRAFARDLKLPASTLSGIFKKKTGLSSKMATQIAKKLQLQDDEKEFFQTLVQASCARKKSDRQLARVKLGRFETRHNTLSTDHFQVIADWYHLAIVELTQIKGFDSSPHWIAKKLQITPEEAQMALGRLLRLNILELTDKGLQPATDYLIVLSHSPSESAKKFQTQILEKLAHSLSYQERNTRDISSIILKMRAQDIDGIKKVLKDFRRDLSRDIQDGDGHDSVYCLTTGLFRLDNEEKRI